MTVLHPTPNPGKYNSVQWTGSNLDEIKTLVGSGAYKVVSDITNNDLIIIDVYNANRATTLPQNGWLVLGPYWDPENEQITPIAEYLNDYNYQLKYGTPAV